MAGRTREYPKYHNNNSPIAHKKKHELVQGDATHELPAYLDRNPQTIIALAYFDFDIYEPTKVCLEAILPYLTRGSIIAFDELNVPEFPGETVALREVLGSSKYAIRRDSSAPLTSYIVSSRVFKNGLIIKTWNNTPRLSYLATGYGLRKQVTFGEFQTGLFPP